MALPTRGLRLPLALVAVLAACALIAPAAQAAPDPAPPGANDWSCETDAAHPRPVVLVHGLSATMAGNWGYLSPRVAEAGYCVFALTYGQDPRADASPYSPGGVVRMEESARELDAFVDEVLAATGAAEVDIVGHSEGTVMPRWYLERLGGAAKVRKFVALTPLWRGTTLAGLDTVRDLGAGFGISQPMIDAVAAFCASCPQFLRGSEYLNDLNADGEAIPGIEHTNITTRYDELVTPYTSGWMRDGGKNVILQQHCPLDLSEHAAVAFDPVVRQMVLNALAGVPVGRIHC